MWQFEGPLTQQAGGGTVNSNYKQSRTYRLSLLMQMRQTHTVKTLEKLGGLQAYSSENLIKSCCPMREGV